jgi:hypothetical protein
MQKLDLKPTEIAEPIRKKAYAPKKKNRFALQKKTKTDKTENPNNNDKNDEEELIKNKINEEDFTEPKEEKMLINQEKAEHELGFNNNKDDENNNEKNEDGSKEEKEPSANMEEKENYIEEEQENLIANHMDIIKNEAQLLTEEGNLISKIKGITEENYTMEEYVPKIEEIINSKLKYFRELKNKIKKYKSLLG